jgi:carbonic anhydrase
MTDAVDNVKENNWISDILASLVVFLVAVPLALGIALASGAPSLLSGLIACVVGGVVAGLIAGAPLQVSGPAAGLTVIVFNLIQEFGWPVTCAITLCAGVVQMILGWAKVGRISLAISSSVVHGMLAGIGLVIVLSQLHVVLGGSPQSSAIKNLIELPGQLLEMHGAATGLGLFTIVIMAFWHYMPRKARVIPSALVAVVLATVASLIIPMQVPRVDLPGGLQTALSLPSLPEMSKLTAFIIGVFTLAIVASVESLLCAVATDKLHSGKRANLNRELLGQGAGNFVSGLIGGLPITGVIVRSSANIVAGAKTKWSAVFHGLWILFFVIFFSQIISVIPLAVLAGLLVYVGGKLIDPKHIKHLHTQRQTIIYFITFAAVAFWNLLGGVALGVGLSVFLLLLKLAKTDICVETSEGKWHVSIQGALTFVSVPELTSALAGIPEKSHVEIDLLVDFIDHAALDALHQWRVAHEKNGGVVDIDELHERWNQRSEGEGWSPIVVKRINQSSTSPLVENLAPNTGSQPIVGFLNGVSRFQKSTSFWKQPLFNKLASEGQSPKILFVGCSDSRVVPNLITNTKPGDMFTMQNIGNLIPAYPDTSVSATLDFALQNLKVEHIMICGHSDCGAMKALSGTGAGRPSDNVMNWIKHGNSTLDLLKEIDNKNPILKLDPDLSVADRTAQVNVLQQLRTLTGYPAVRQHLQEGKVNLWGLFFDIAAAELYIFDDRSRRFVTVDEMMAEGRGVAAPKVSELFAGQQV